MSVMRWIFPVICGMGVDGVWVFSVGAGSGVVRPAPRLFVVRRWASGFGRGGMPLMHWCR